MRNGGVWQVAPGATIGRAILEVRARERAVERGKRRSGGGVGRKGWAGEG